MKRLLLIGVLIAVGLLAFALYRVWPWAATVGGLAWAVRHVYGPKRARKAKTGHPWLAAGAGLAAGMLLPASWHEKRQERTGFQDWTCGYCGAPIAKPLMRRYCNPHCAHAAKLVREGKDIYDPNASFPDGF